MAKYDIVIKPLGSQAILIEWPNRIDDAILDDILQFTASITSREKEALNNYTPGYNSLLLQYRSTIDLEKKKETLLHLYQNQTKAIEHAPKNWHIPVCYNEEFGIDLSRFRDIGLTSNDVITLHTSKSFRIYMIGFLPGFLYLGGLPKELHMNRKKKPRLDIPKGSVAIGGEQTGIYPMNSPGGWQIIGRTPLTLFNLEKEEPTPMRQGDYIQFYPVDIDFYKNFNSHI